MDWSWAIAPNKEETEEAPALPFWEDPEQVARTVYEFWTNSMRSDRIDSIVMPHYLSELPADARQNLIESFNTNVIQPIRKMREEAAIAIQEARQEDERLTLYECPCYTCDRGIAHRRGGMCPACQRRFECRES